MKRVVSGFSLIFCIVLLMQTMAFAATDKPSSWAAEEVNAAIQEGLVPAELQQNYTKPVSRGAVAKMFVNLLEKSSGKTSAELLTARGATINSAVFTDTTDEAVLICNALGLINGVGGSRFDPNGTLTRSQIAAIMNRAAEVLGFSTANYPHGFTDTKNNWVDSELGWVKHVGIITGVGGNRFDPEGELTTEQAILITYRALHATTEVVWRKVRETQISLGEDGKAISTTKFTWTYDERGNNTASTRETTEGDSTYGWDVTCTYNEYGDVISERGVCSGYYDRDLSYTYYEDGSIQSWTTTSVGEANDNRTVSFQYDAAGRVVSKSEKHNNYGNSETTYLYEYDTHGNTIREGRLRGDEVIWADYNNEYDSAGHLTKRSRKDNDSFQYFEIYEYTYDGDNLIAQKLAYGYGNEESWRNTTSYSNFDNHGNPCHIEETISYPSGNKEAYITDYEYTDYEYEYEPVKKASLPFHWKGASTAIKADTIG